jgi:hypothetical protein
MLAGDTAAITTVIVPYHADQTADTTGLAYIKYSNESIEPHDTKSGASTLDDEVYNLILFSQNPDTLLSLAKAVRADLDRAPAQTLNAVAFDGLQYLDTNDMGFDVKTERYDVELRFKIRVKRTP